MANTEVGSAYISVWPEMSNFTKEVTNAINGIDGGIKKATNKASSSIVAGFGGAFADVATIGASVIGGIGASISALAIGGGLARAMTIDEARFKLKTLGIAWEDVYSSMDTAVQGTQYSLASAATATSILGSSGVSAGEQMTRALQGVVGAATVSGDSMENIAQIFAKVSANGKISGEELMQFSARGVNALKVLADYTGKSQDEIKKMVKEGKVDFDTFANAFTAFGEAAKESNDTIAGATANLQSAFSRLGEKFMTPILSHMVQLFNALRPAVNALTSALEPLAKNLNSLLDSVLPPIIEKIGEFESYLKGLGENGILNASKGVQALGIAFAALSAGGLATAVTSLPLLGPILGGILSPIAALLNPIALLCGGGEKLSEAFGKLKKETLPGIAKGFGNLKNVLALIGMEFTGASTIGASFIAGLKAIPVGLSLLVSPIGLAVAAIAALAAGFAYCWTTSEEFRNSVTTAVQGILPFVELLATQASELASVLLPILSEGIASIGEALAGLATAAMPLIQAAFQILVAAIESAILIITGIITVLTELIKWFQELPSSISAFCTEVQSFFNDFEQGVIDAFNSLVEGVTSFVTRLVDGVSHDFNSMVTNITSWVSGFVSSVIGFFANLIATVIGAVAGFASSVASFFSSMASNAVSVVSGFVSNVISFFANMVSSASGEASNLVSSVAGIIGSLPGMAFSWGADMIRNLISGIQSIDVVGAVSAVAGTISSFLHFSEPDVGPLSNFHTFMPDMMKLMSQGIKSNVWRVEREIKGVAGMMANGINSVRPSLPASRGGSNVVVNLNYSAGEDANTLARDIGLALRRMTAMEG